MVVILLNTGILATDQFPNPEMDLIQQSNKMFTIYFATELLIKMTGMTFQEWRSDLFNIYDFIIVTASCVELGLSNTQVTFISALRVMRLLRIFKLARSNFTLKCLLDSIGQTIYQCANFIVILSIFIYTFALLGMEMFAGKFKFDEFGRFDPVNGMVPRQNYDHITWAIVTVFQIFIGDKWDDIMYMAYQSSNKGAVIYFIFLVLFGRIVLQNLFLALLLGYFEQASIKIREQTKKAILGEFTSNVKVF